MSETVSRSMGKTITGLVLLLVSFVGMAAVVSGGVGIATDDLSCTYSPRCGTYTLFLVVGVLVAVPGLIFGLVLLLSKPRQVQPVAGPVPSGHPAWALICGALSCAVTLICGFLALNWLLGYLAEPENPFSGLALLLAIGAGIVATGFLILGIMLFAKKQ